MKIAPQDTIAPTLKLAGFTFEHDNSGTLTGAFVRFCAPDQDPATLPETAWHPVLKREWPVAYPTLTASDIAEILTAAGTQKRFGGPRGELARAADPVGLANILLLMRQARAVYDRRQNDRTDTVFIPVTSLHTPGMP